MTPFLLHHLAEGCPAPTDKPVIVDGDIALTRKAFLGAVRGLAGRLISAGLEPGDRVVIALPKSPMECVAIFAISMAGGVLVPANPALVDDQVRHIVEDCGARFALAEPDRIAQLDRAFAHLESPPRFVDATLPSETASPPAQASDAAMSNGRIGEDLAAILYTSGSTGRPKGVMLSHRNLLAGTRIVRTYLGINGSDRILSVLPLSFDYGLNQLLTAVEQGATLVLCRFRMGDEIVAALKQNHITGLAGVPSIWAILTRAAPSLARSRLPHLRYITNTGGAVPSATVRRLRELVPDTRIFLMYGLTEAFRSTYLPPEEVDRRPTSIGRAIPECEVFVVTQDGRRAKPGEPGILVHRGPTVSLGYWNRPEDTAGVLRPNPFRPAVQGGDLVCYSGDLVTMDEDGFLYFVARNDAMIKSAGFRISPSEVEEVLMTTGAFAQIAVIGLPDDFLGQRVHAVGVAVEEPVPTARILERVTGRLAQHMLPKTIEWIDQLPLTGNGKIDYKQLVAERS
jgi:acyl-CoA ligase (AMP-forming) (exosortase A-associated)